MTEPTDPWQPRHARADEPEIYLGPPAMPTGGSQAPAAAGYPPSAAPAYGWVPPAWLTDAPPPPPPAPRRNRAPWIALAVGVLLVAAGAVWFVARHDSSSSAAGRLVMPERIGAYTQVHGAAADRERSLISGFAQGSTAGKRFFQAASFAFYGKDAGDTPQLVSFAAPASAAAGSPLDVDQLRSLDPNARTYPAGPRGGTVACAVIPIATQHETLCAWQDAQVVGVLVSVLPALPGPQAATVVNQLRDELH
ncbi:MAG: hypothetical protein ACTHMS_14475 [Jatrophihabitans sp.]|uniref:hypothetical protein n=1 Tax=Jatrophihabitans sp. TaxID=1932789 RepID=UPI003F7EC492